MLTGVGVQILGRRARHGLPVHMAFGGSPEGNWAEPCGHVGGERQAEEGQRSEMEPSARSRGGWSPAGGEEEARSDGRIVVSPLVFL